MPNFGIEAGPKLPAAGGGARAGEVLSFCAAHTSPSTSCHLIGGVPRMNFPQGGTDALSQRLRKPRQMILSRIAGTLPPIAPRRHEPDDSADALGILPSSGACTRDVTA